ncbi:MAG: aminotransferase class IV [Desulfomonilaceae bacterium]
MTIISYQRDHFVPSSELSFPFFDDISGTLRGYRVFTACRSIRGKIFRLEDHLDRLYNSASGIHMKPPVAREALKQIMAEIVDRNVKSGIQDDLLIDIIFSGGLAGNTMKTSDNGAYLYVAVQPLEVPPDELYENGIALATFPHLRICPDIKLLHYIGAIMAHQTVVPTAAAEEVLFVDPCDRQTILEGSTFTIFFINSDGEVLTPPLDGKILDSITRKVVLEILQQQNIKILEIPVLLSQINSLAESFIASTTRNVLPVTRIDSTIVGNGKPGPVTESVIGSVNTYLDAY